MSNEFLVEGLKSNWHLLLVCVAIFIGAGVWAVMPSQEGDAAGVVAAETYAPPKTAQAHAYTNRWTRPTANDEVKLAIANYERELAQNRQSEETAANLFRLANLYYSKHQNYEEAALYYENLLQDFEEFEMMNTAFLNLAACYERQAKFDLERQTYRRMKEYFAPDSKEYEFAMDKLGY